MLASSGRAFTAIRGVIASAAVLSPEPERSGRAARRPGAAACRPPGRSGPGAAAPRGCARDDSSSVGSMPTSRSRPSAVALHTMITGLRTRPRRSGTAPASARAVRSGRATATPLGISSPTTIWTTVVSSRASTTGPGRTAAPVASRPPSSGSNSGGHHRLGQDAEAQAAQGDAELRPRQVERQPLEDAGGGAGAPARPRSARGPPGCGRPPRARTRPRRTRRWRGSGRGRRPGRRRCSRRHYWLTRESRPTRSGSYRRDDTPTVEAGTPGPVVR